MVLKGSLLEQNHQMGVFVSGSDVTIEASVVRTTQPDAQEMFRRGFDIEDDPDTETGARS